MADWLIYRLTAYCSIFFEVISILFNVETHICSVRAQVLDSHQLSHHCRSPHHLHRLCALNQSVSGATGSSIVYSTFLCLIAEALERKSDFTWITWDGGPPAFDCGNLSPVSEPLLCPPDTFCSVILYRVQEGVVIALLCYLESIRPECISSEYSPNCRFWLKNTFSNHKCQSRSLKHHIHSIRFVKGCEILIQIVFM